MAETKLAIFDILNAVNNKNANYFDKLTDDEIKTIQPFVLMRWLTGTDDEAQIIMLNEFVNPYAFSLTEHKELVWKLLTIANSGNRQRYSWTKLDGKKNPNKPISMSLVQRKYGYNESDASDALQLLSSDQIMNIAWDFAIPTDEMTKLKKELK